jgi:hypothetical protein
MSMFGSDVDLLRVRKGHESGRVTFVELFFDLVFVFAITQISHFLLEHFSLAGVLEATLLFLAVWWVWMYTSWATNWLNPDTAPVRLLVFALMLAGLVMSTSLPQAFSSRGLAFAAAYVFSQVGRCLFMLWALRKHHRNNFLNFQRITAWLAFSGAFWIAGGFAEHEQRFALWAIALAIEYASPAAGFWTPGLGRSETTDWDVAGDHMAERCGLFVIIALGESILVTGATFAKMDWTAPVIAAFLVACRQRGDVVDLFQSRRRTWTPSDRGLRRSRPARASGLYLYAHADYRRHRRVGGVGRADPCPSRRAYRFQDRGDDHRRRGDFSDRQYPVQADHDRTAHAVALGRTDPARDPCAICAMAATARLRRLHQRHSYTGRYVGDLVVLAGSGGRAVSRQPPRRIR